MGAHYSGVEVVDARLGSATFWTGRGEASVPVCEFSLEGTRVKATRVAVANYVSVVPPP